ncbi:MAG TPA: hypothetical protein VFM05_02155 [Candidatus Saccharimonadales bacterium]|nr:hypothetical protein [Candidatus Saccharimonadales bacterium]
MPQEIETYAPLSVHRAFVVHFRTNSDIAQGRVTGRVEHIASGQLTHFTSLEELLTFLGRVLATVRGPPQRKSANNR